LSAWAPLLGEGSGQTELRTTTMTTYNMTEGCDFARGVAEPRVAESMQLQLGRPGRSSDNVRRFARVVELAERDSRLSLPDYAVRVAKAAGSLRLHSTSRHTARRPFTVLFDSFLEAACVGTRALDSSHQQIVYRSDDYTVELRLEQETNPHRQVVVGQVLHHQGDVQPVSRVPVLVLSGGRVVGRDLTSCFGEFQAADLPPEALELCLLVNEEVRIDLPLGGDTPQGQDVS
jgi:hypothetical protein